MRPFTGADAGRFFGRDLELDRIVRRESGASPRASPSHLRMSIKVKR